MASSHDPVEDQIRRAIESGEFDDLPGSGRRLELGENDPAWWAKRKVDEIRRQERAFEMGRRIADLEDKIWPLADEEAVVARIAEINAEIEVANAGFAAADRLSSLDANEVIRTWRRMYRLRS